MVAFEVALLKLFQGTKDNKKEFVRARDSGAWFDRRVGGEGAWARGKLK